MTVYTSAVETIISFYKINIYQFSDTDFNILQFEGTGKSYAKFPTRRNNRLYSIERPGEIPSKQKFMHMLMDHFLCFGKYNLNKQCHKSKH